MAINYPSGIDSFTDPSGTQTLASPDHAGMHTDVHSALEAIETAIGTTSGTAMLKNLSVGKFAPASDAGTITNTIIGTPTVTGGTASGFRISSGTLAGVLLGTSTITGGTASAMLIGTSTITGGTAGGVTLGTPIIDFFTSSGTTLPTTANRALSPTVGTTADNAGGTITVNAPSASIFEITLGTTAGNRTIGTPTNPKDGMMVSFRVKQNSNNTGTLIWPSIYVFNDSGTPALGTTSSWNYFGFRYHTGDVKYHFQGASNGIV